LLPGKNIAQQLAKTTRHHARETYSNGTCAIGSRKLSYNKITTHQILSRRPLQRRLANTGYSRPTKIYLTELGGSLVYDVNQRMIRPNSELYVHLKAFTILSDFQSTSHKDVSVTFGMPRCCYARFHSNINSAYNAVSCRRVVAGSIGSRNELCFVLHIAQDINRV